MESSDLGAFARRLTALSILTAIMLGLLVWYGTVSGTTGGVATWLVELLGFGLLGSGIAALPGSGALSVAADAAPRPAVVAGVLSTGVDASVSPTVDVVAVPLAHHREPWEAYYMYGVSAVAACWVFKRVCSQWRFDPRTLSVRPRTRGDSAELPRLPVERPVDGSSPRARDGSSPRARDGPPTGRSVTRAAHGTTPATTDRPAALTAAGPADGRRRLPPSPTERRGLAASAAGRAVPDGGDRDA